MHEAAQQATGGESDLLKELNRLGENIGNLLRSFWESEERKSVEREIAKGVEELNKQINKAVEQAKADKTVEKAKQGMKEAWETAHGPKIVGEVQAGVIDALHSVNAELAKRAEKKPAVEVKPTEETAPAPEAPPSEPTPPDAPKQA